MNFNTLQTETKHIIQVLIRRSALSIQVRVFGADDYKESDMLNFAYYFSNKFSNTNKKISQNCSKLAPRVLVRKQQNSSSPINI